MHHPIGLYIESCPSIYSAEDNLGVVLLRRTPPFGPVCLLYSFYTERIGSGVDGHYLPNTSLDFFFATWKSS